MKNLFNRLFTKPIFFLLLFLLSITTVSAQPENINALEEPKTAVEVLLFFTLLIILLLAPAFKKREWPKLRKGYTYFID